MESGKEGWGAEEVSLGSGGFRGDVHVEEADMVEDEALGILLVTGLVMYEKILKMHPREAILIAYKEASS
ncbi:hypothetical protein L3X38_006794 [Prunus dulcis]|uniref:Uncharacterized protein n=1 Tax=Prunus dulcis TaxID=3755 RepID=A0AAD5F5K1_PRUDU|nr:hypothetical protein L3X38_006794 [Prunus dulcis]